MKDMRTIKKSE